MTREMMKRIRERKQEAAELVRYATPRTGRIHNWPSKEHVAEILIQHIPYMTERPTITDFRVLYYNRNRIIKSAKYRVETSDGKAWEIDAYENLTGRTPQQKEEDKTADFPSGLFKIFHEEIKIAE